jgi:hypothetical protein
MTASELHELQAFEAHPESRFQVGGVYTRRSPYPSFQVLSRVLLKKGSDSLLDLALLRALLARDAPRRRHAARLARGIELGGPAQEPAWIRASSWATAD